MQEDLIQNEYGVKTINPKTATAVEAVIIGTSSTLIYLMISELTALFRSTFYRKGRVAADLAYRGLQSRFGSMEPRDVKDALIASYGRLPSKVMLSGRGAVLQWILKNIRETPFIRTKFVRGSSYLIMASTLLKAALSARDARRDNEEVETLQGHNDGIDDVEETIRLNGELEHVNVRALQIASGNRESNNININKHSQESIKATNMSAFYAGVAASQAGALIIAGDTQRRKKMPKQGKLDIKFSAILNTRKEWVKAYPEVLECLLTDPLTGRRRRKEESIRIARAGELGFRMVSG
jgi:hypothetical protein